MRLRLDTPTVEDVREFWNEHPCDSATSTAEDRRRYFAEIRQKRYSAQWHIPVIANFDAYRDRDVLEIGCGLGTDGLEFARRGARYVGLDLSERSIELAHEHFELAGIACDLRVADAEHLPFADVQFDHVYSFGAIHHSPATETIVDEIHRVLRPGGTFCVMVYNRSSINYKVEIMLLRRLFRIVLYHPFAPRFLARLLRFDRAKLERHRSLMLERGRLSCDRWLSMNTDGPDCPLARVYSKREAAELFGNFDDVESTSWFFNEHHWPVVGRVLPGSARRALGRRWGWHRVVTGRKPA